MDNYFQNKNMIKSAGVISAIAGKNILTRVLSWLFMVLVASAGFMLAGDIINKYILGRSNAFDDNLHPGTSSSEQTSSNSGSGGEVSHPTHTSTQTKFKIQPGYHEENKNISAVWGEQISNDLSSIGDMLIIFAKQVYQGLDGLDSIIKMTPGFQVIRDRIFNYNETSRNEIKSVTGPTTSLVYIPRYFTSKKQIVDFFIDDVASATPAATNTTH